MRRHLLILVATAAAALALPTSALAACDHVDTLPNPENLDQVAAATLCLINVERADSGLPALRRQEQLDQASLDYSELMVDQQFFAHESPTGSVLTQRLTDAGYLGGDGAWVVGENIAWGESYLGTPGAIVTAWMNSPGHRENILSTDYDEIGVGIAVGVPASANDGATYTTDFGHRDDGGTDEVVAAGDEAADGAGGESADDAATAVAPTTAKRSRTAGRKASRRARTKTAACGARGRRGATRQALRGRCLRALKRRHHR